jgi:large subunit ribosomal protein L32|uniref:Large ribosomal subunit protein bL32c n=1 Tax=Galdieria yellowstonensis TaxID=3028027 RepID=A0A9Y1I2Z7_9RHOD|nr:ribosomal protein L32 [Galdieria yellowstonensis]WDA99521.1 ribosomal protein L32 [Galdieria yellowstonensis]
MAVPKKKTSKSKTKARKATWKNKAAFAVSKALTLAKSVFNKKSKFIYNNGKEEKEEQIIN